MALAQVIIIANQVESARIGHQAISLTHYDDNLEPAIAAGSVVEVGGALFEAAVDEAIAGLGAIANDNDIYIKLTAAGASVTASGTLVAPTWSTSKQGWYSGADRYIGGLYKDAGGNYTLKYLYHFVGNNNLKIFGDGTIGIWDGIGFLAKKVLEIGDWDMDTVTPKTLIHGIANYKKIRTVRAMIRDDADWMYVPLDGEDSGGGAPAGWIQPITGVAIYLNRVAGGLFDNANFDLTPYNRGWVTIEYEV